MEGYRASAVTQAEPVARERWALAGHSKALEAKLDKKLVDLEEMTTRRARAKLAKEVEAIENQLDRLETKQAQLNEKYYLARLSDEQINSLDTLKEKAARRLAKARKSFAHRRRLVEILEVEAKAAVEDGLRVIHAKAVFGSQIVGCNSSVAASFFAQGLISHNLPPG